MPLARLYAALSQAYSIERPRMALTGIRDPGLSCG
jgi:hypothetical protein